MERNGGLLCSHTVVVRCNKNWHIALEMNMLTCKNQISSFLRMNTRCKIFDDFDLIIKMHLLKDNGLITFNSNFA